MKTDNNDLIIKYLSGNASVEEEKEILDWVKEDPSNEEEFNFIKKIWEQALHLKKERLTDESKAWQDFKLLSKTQPQPKRFKLQPLQIAATVILCIGLFVLIKFLFVDKATVFNVDQKSEILIPSTKIKYVTISTTDSAKVFFLPDSSCVRLNKKSQLVYPENFNPSKRVTALNGEAFFEVKKDSVPFVILCKQTKTIVIGTSFNIRGYENEKNTTISVVTGTVNVLKKDNASQSGKLVLTANEKGIFNSESSSFYKTNYNSQDFSSTKKTTLKAKIKKIFNKLKEKI